MQKILILVLCCLTFGSYAQSPKEVSYNDGSQQLKGIAVSPRKSLAGKPGILVLPAWMGIDAHSKKVAERLAASGYYKIGRAHV